VVWVEALEQVLVGGLALVEALVHLVWAMVEEGLALVLLGNHLVNCNWCPSLCCTGHHWLHLDNLHKLMHRPKHSSSIQCLLLSQPTRQATVDEPW
jgi:hypothetical protein